MRQVPDYLIIGSGRIAKHFSHYLYWLKIPFQQWSPQVDLQQKNLLNLMAVYNPADVAQKISWMHSPHNIFKR